MRRVKGLLFVAAMLVLFCKETRGQDKENAISGSMEMLPGKTTGSQGWVKMIQRGDTIRYTTVRAADGNVWLQQNLGSSRVAVSLTDTGAYGGLFQWGRWADGHESRNPERLLNSVPFQNPDKINRTKLNPFYFTTDTNWWATGTADDRWIGPTPSANDVTTTNGCDPCRAMGRDWRLPVDSEWVSLTRSEHITNTLTAFSSNLKLPAGGHRDASTGQLLDAGTEAFYWSSTVSAITGKGVATAFENKSLCRSKDVYRGAGFSLRCIRNSKTDPPVPGVVIAHVPASLGYYIGSPSIVALSNGVLIASHDFFGGPGAKPNGQATSRVYKSIDEGTSWKIIAGLDGQSGSTLFVHNGVLYIMGMGSGRNIVIRKSVDQGDNWTTGLLRKARHYSPNSGYQSAPTPVAEYNGRIWKVMEDWGGPEKTFAVRFRTFMMSAPVNSDLLDSASWVMSNPMGYDSTYLDGDFGGWLEGNVVVAPDGQMLDIARVHTLNKTNEKAALIHISNDGTKASFDPSTGFVNMPGGAKKFTIRFDSVTNKYWTLSNYVPAPYTGITNLSRVRNTMALCSSTDLHTWKVVKIILQNDDIYYHGYQYPDWQFQGDDIIAVSRTSHTDAKGEGADSFHNANLLTFHRIKKFRDYQ